MGKVIKVDLTDVNGDDAFYTKALTLTAPFYMSYRWACPNLTPINDWAGGVGVAADLITAIAVNFSGTAGDGLIGVDFGNTGAWKFIGDFDPSYGSGAAAGSFTPNVWHSVEMRYDGTDIFWRVDGVDLFSYALDSTYLDSPIQVGATFAPNITATQVYYIADLKIGSSYGAGDIFEPDVEADGFSDFDSSTNPDQITVIDDPIAPAAFTAPTIRKVATITGTGGSATGGGNWDTPFTFDDHVAADEWLMMVVGGAMLDGTVSPAVQPQPASATLLQANIDDDGATHSSVVQAQATLTRGPTPVVYPFPNPGTQITKIWPLTGAISAGASGTVRLENQFASTRDIADFVAVVLAIKTTPTVIGWEASADDAMGGIPGNQTADYSDTSIAETVTAFDDDDDGHYPLDNFPRDADAAHLLVAAFSNFSLDPPVYWAEGSPISPGAPALASGAEWEEFVWADDGSGLRVGVAATQIPAGDPNDYSVRAEWESAVGSSGALVQIRVNAFASGGVGLRAWQRF